MNNDIGEYCHKNIVIATRKQFFKTALRKQF